MAQINLAIPDELHHHLKLKALKQETTLKQLIIETLNKTR